MNMGTLFLEVGDGSTVAACRDWYAKHLGLTVKREEADESVWFDVGNGVELGFHTGDPVGNAPAVNLSFVVEDVDAEAARLQGEGVRIYQEPWDAPWGSRVATTVDPAGHAVWFSGPLSS